MKTMVVVDTAANINREIMSFLERAGICITIFHDEKNALEYIEKNSPDIIVAEVRASNINGINLLLALRGKNIWTPFIFYTQYNDSSECVFLLEAGADDYILKQTLKIEILARLRSILRRSEHCNSVLSQTFDQLVADRLCLDRSSRRVWLDTKEIHLTPKSISLLEYFMRHPQQSLSRENILNAVWGWNYVGGTRIVDARVNELRQKLELDPKNPVYIRTILGQGYYFVPFVKLSS